MITLTPEEARQYLVGHLGLRAVTLPTGADGARAVLQTLRCIQLDPLDRIGPNADLVALARVDGIRQGDLFRHNYPGGAFEHFAKERCLLPASAFPYYRDQAVVTPWWRLTERLRRLPQGVVEAVLDEVSTRGPLTSAALTPRGRVEALDWSGWKGTSRAAKMALEVLWTRCQVVVCARNPSGKVYDIPERALPDVAAQSVNSGFGRWSVLERVEAMGLLPRAGGPHWSMLRDVRTSDLPNQLVQEGQLVEVTITGSRRTYLAPPDFRDRTFPEDDGRMRILGPLDPLLWDRKLVKHIFDFDYVWEVYKPASKRRWGWYVCPILHRGALVARVEGRRESGALAVDNLWVEDGRSFDKQSWKAAWERHQAAVC